MSSKFCVCSAGPDQMFANVVTLISTVLQVVLMFYVLQKIVVKDNDKHASVKHTFQVVLALMCIYGAVLFGLSFTHIVKGAEENNKLRDAYCSGQTIKKADDECHSDNSEQNVTNYLTLVHSVISFVFGLVLVVYFLYNYVQEKKSLKLAKFKKEFPNYNPNVTAKRIRGVGSAFGNIYTCEDGLNWNMFLVLLSSVLAGTSATSFGYTFKEVKK